MRDFWLMNAIRLNVLFVASTDRQVVASDRQKVNTKRDLGFGYRGPGKGPKRVTKGVEYYSYTRNRL